MLLLDAAVVRAHVRLWREMLPDVEPFYSVKSNGDPELLRLLGALGCGFDCASAAELEAAGAVGGAKLGVSHPCRVRSHLRVARRLGATTLAVDSVGELRKIAEEFPEAKLLLRVDDRPSQKFGASPDAWGKVAGEARRLRLDIVGVALHVGSDCASPQGHQRLIELAHRAAAALRDEGFDPSTLSLGGGFPADSIAFATFARALVDALEPFQGWKLMAEPGRFLVARCGTLLTQVVGVSEAEGRRRVYMNDGVYGALSGIIFDGRRFATPRFLVRRPAAATRTVVYGPTCDGLDTLWEGPDAPELREGDWLAWPDAGAYSLASASTFNGFPLARAVLYDSSASAMPEGIPGAVIAKLLRGGTPRPVASASASGLSGGEDGGGDKPEAAP